MLESNETSVVGFVSHNNSSYPLATSRPLISILSLPKSKSQNKKNVNYKEYYDLKMKNKQLIEELNKIRIAEVKETKIKTENFRVSKETVSFLKSMSNNKFAYAIIDCKAHNKDLNFDLMKQDEITTLTDDFSTLIQICFDNLFTTKNHADRINHQTFIYNLLESVKYTRFGEDAFKSVSNKLESLLKKFATVIPIEGVVEKIAEFDENTLLSEIFRASAIFKPLNSHDDTELKIMYGKNTVYRSEVAALKSAINHVHNIYYIFESELREILEGKFKGKSFKAEAKSYERAMWKLEEYAYEDFHATFDYLTDLLKCTAAFDDPKQIVEAYKYLAKNFKIFKFKNKMDTPLNNWTLNMNYKDMIVEVQLIFGTIASEFENHKIYELVRTRGTIEMYDVVEKWGGYHLISNDQVTFKLIDSRPRMFEKTKMIDYVPLLERHQKDSKIKVIRTMEFGVNNQICQYWDDSIEKSYYFKEDTLKILRIKGSEKGLSELKMIYQDEGTESLANLDQTDYLTHKMNTPDDLIIKVEGTYDDKKGIMSLKITTKYGQELSVGKTDEGSKFNYIIPDGYHVIGFGGKKKIIEGEQRIISLYCWLSTLKISRLVDRNHYCEGEWKGDKRHGYCVYENEEGNRYEGRYEDDKKSGYGVLYYANCDVYEGEWKDDKRNGYGKFYHANGQHYEGSWVNDKKEGSGNQYYSNNDHYEGEWKNDQRNGYGFFFFDLTNSRSLYEGEWAGDVQNGPGTWRNAKDDFIATGTFENGLNGKLELVYANGNKFIGTFLNGKKHGYGELIEATGIEYKGNWSNDVPHGSGVKKFSNGEIVEGNWTEGKLHGFGVLIKADGKQYNMKYENDKIISGIVSLKNENDDRYDGEIMDYKLHGKGDLFLAGKMKYSGEWHNNLKHGQGKFYFDSERFFEGGWHYGMPHGKGILNIGVEKFEGDYFYGIIKEGKGVLFYPQGGYYIGDFKNFHMEGQGEMYNKTEKLVYKGGYKDSLRDGYGVFYTKDGSRFEGGWKKGYQNGKGVFIDKSNTKITNFYSKGKAFEGKGVTLSDINCYYGDYKGGKYEGNGEFYDEFGAHFTGAYRNGNKNGQGRLESPFGGVLTIPYVNNLAEGEGKFKGNGIENDVKYAADGPKVNAYAVNYTVYSFYEGYLNGGSRVNEGKQVYKTGMVHQGKYELGYPNAEGKFILPDGELLTGYIYKAHLKGEYKIKTKFFETIVNYQNDRPIEGYGFILEQIFGYINYKGDFKNNKKHGFGIESETNDITYIGSFENGKKKGYGISFFSNKASYIGEWNDDKKEGTGILLLLSGGRFEGNFSNSLPHGKGVYTTPNGEMHEEEYQEGKIKNGCGIIFEEKGILYEGSIKDGKMHGKGIYYENFNYADRMEGLFEDDNFIEGVDFEADYTYQGTFKGKSGKGKIDTPLGIVEGQWDDTKGNYSGIVKLPIGGVLQATWRNFMLHGTCTYTDEEGNRYEGYYKEEEIIQGSGIRFVNNSLQAKGEFVNYKLHGKGTIYDTASGNVKYEGDFKLGKKWGKGIEHNADGSKFEIEFLNDLKHGKGVLTTSENKLYDVEYDNGIIVNGLGISLDSEGNTYTGEFKNKFYHGNGKLQHIDGSILYEGEWVEGFRHGQGISYDTKKKSSYKGSWKYNLWHGEGIVITEANEEYKGNYYNGVIMSGLGFITLPNNRIYIGSFENGLQNGQGKIIFENKNEFEGTFKNGLKHGPGKAFFKDVAYEAEYEYDYVKSGRSIIIENGALSYEGKFKDGLPHGNGIQYYDDSKIMYEGSFENGVYEGEGTWFDKNRNEFVGVFKNGLKNGEFDVYNPQYILMIQGEYIDDLLEGAGICYFTNDEVIETNYQHGRVVGDKGIVFNTKRYEGEFKNLIAHGQGTLYFYDGRKYYTGSFVADYFEGYGEQLLIRNGQTYKGNFKKGVFDGFATLYDPKGNKLYEATYSKAQVNGVLKWWSGNQTFERFYTNGSVDDGPGSDDYGNGSWFKGYYKNAKKNGEGTHHTKNGNTLVGYYVDDIIVNGDGRIEEQYWHYEGGFKDRKKHGKGKQYVLLKNNACLEGIYQNNYIKNGRGIAIYNGGNILYAGDFVNGLRHGEGKSFIVGTSVWYISDWKNDKPSAGVTIYAYENGDVYVGNFNNGIKEGRGTYTHRRGDIYDGSWRKGQRHGEGILTYLDEKKFTVVYDHGKLLSKSEIV